MAVSISDLLFERQDPENHRLLEATPAKLSATVKTLEDVVEAVEKVGFRITTGDFRIRRMVRPRPGLTLVQVLREMTHRRPHSFVLEGGEIYVLTGHDAIGYWAKRLGSQ